MTSQPTVLAVAGDAGGAEALGAVLERLVRDRRVRIRALGYRQAPAIWRRRGLEYDEVPESASDGDLYSLVHGVDLLLAATSVNGIDLERRCLEVAQPLAVPSLAVLDNWSQYRRRFTAPFSPHLIQPDRIAVMDETARAEMTQAGFEAERLIVTGQPALTELRARRDEFGAERRGKLRASIGVGESTALVLFASESLSRPFSVGELPVAVGYDEHQVLLALVAALERIGRRLEREVVLAIRPHPREPADSYEQYSSSVIRITRAGGFEGIEWALAADLVVGMTSLLVAQAAGLGGVAVSLQPHTSMPDPLPSNRVGLSTPVYLYSLIEPVVETLLVNREAREEAVSREGAAATPADSAERIAHLAYELIQPGGRP